MSDSVCGKLDRWNSCTHKAAYQIIGVFVLLFEIESYSSPVFPGIYSEKSYIPSAQIGTNGFINKRHGLYFLTGTGRPYSAQAGFELKSHPNLNLSSKDPKFKIKIKVL